MKHTITCPHCGFTRDVPREAIPEGASAVRCPSCGERFPFRDEPPRRTPVEEPARPTEGSNASGPSAGHAAGSPAESDRSAGDEVICPVCSTGQEASQSCVNCGLIFAKWEEVRREGDDFYLADTGAPLRSESQGDQGDALDALPRAGFWQRLTAALIDLTILAVAQVFFGALLGGVAALVSWGWQLEPGGWQTVMAPVKLFNIVLFLAYFIVFTGYGGQTPGKMMLRIKVIREENGEIGYLRAFLREAPGKLISTLTFGFGFIMIAFQPDKRGLHDLLSGSSVVRLR